MPRRCVGLVLRSAVRAGLPAVAITLACLGVEKDGTVLVLLEERVMLAGIDANRLLAVIAVRKHQVQTRLGKCALLPLQDAKRLDRAGLDTKPVTAGKDASAAVVAAALIKIETVLSH